MTKYIFKLYLAGSNSRAKSAVVNLRRIFDEELFNQYELTVIDVLTNPQQAEEDKILATPTLVQEQPLPLRRIIGDLSDKEKLFQGLNICS